MSKIEYNSLLFEISERLDQQNVLGRLLFMCRDFLTPESSRQDSIQDTLSLFKELEDRKCLGVDRLQVLKDLLKGVRQWSLFGKVKKLEGTRTEYNGLIEQIILVLDELNDMERLISICRMESAEANESNIQDVRSLFKELENNECLGIDSLRLLKEILTKTEQGDLLRDVEGFEARRNREDEFESRKAQVADFMSSVGSRLIGVLTVKTVFKVVAGGITVASTLEVLSRGSTFDQLVSAVNRCVLPAGTSLIQITEGCVCLTVQAKNLSSLETLWSLYKDGTLRARLQDFFVNKEVREELAGGEQLEVIVTIEEGEYKKALSELVSSEVEGAASSEETRLIRIHRRNSDSSLYCKTRYAEALKQTPVSSERPPNSQSRFLDQERVAFVQNYLEKAEDARSRVAETSDSGISGTEFMVEETSESSYKLHLKDLSQKVIVELKWRLENDPAGKEKFYKSFDLAPTISEVLENIDELFPDTPAKLLKEMFEALEMYDLADLMEKAKPRTLRPAFPMRELRKTLNASRRPTRFYSKVAVLIFDAEADQADSEVQNIGSFFQGFDSRSKVTTVSLKSLNRACAAVKKWRKIEGDFETGRPQETEKRLKTELQGLQQSMRDLIELFEVDGMMITRTFEMEAEKNEELKKYIEISKMKKKDRKVTIANFIGDTTQELQKERKKFKMTLDKWTPSEDEKSTLFVVYVDVDTSNIQEDAYMMMLTCLKEKLALIPDEPKLLLFPQPVMNLNKEISEALFVWFPPTSVKNYFEATMLTVLSKRWQTLDLVSMMHEIQRTFPLKVTSYLDYERRSRWNLKSISIDDSFSSLPRLQKTEENSA